jgi:T-complex protein 1 subunit gamma
MAVARNVVLNPHLVPGGGAVEMAVARALTDSSAVGKAAGKDKDVAGAAQSAVFKAVAEALEVIPRTLVQNAGGNAIRVLTELRVGGLFFFGYMGADWVLGEACGWGTYVGHRRTRGQDHRHEDLWLIRERKRQGRSYSPHPRLFIHPPSQIQTLKTAIEATRVLLRVDDIVQATRKDKSGGGGDGGQPGVQEMGGPGMEDGEPEMP